MNNTDTELKKTRHQIYYEANKEKIKARKKEYNEVNKDKVKAKSKAYYEANKDKLNAREKAYRARQKPSFFRYLDNMGFFDKYIYPSDPEQCILYCDDNNKYNEHDLGNGYILGSKRYIYALLFVAESTKIYSKEDFNYE